MFNSAAHGPRFLGPRFAPLIVGESALGPKPPQAQPDPARALQVEDLAQPGTALAGGGIVGGQVVGKTSKDGTTVEDRPVTIPDFLATVCQAVGIDPTTQNLSNTGRPVPVVDAAARPVREVLAG